MSHKNNGSVSRSRRVADMSLPPEQRHRKHKGKKSRAQRAQMDHASNAAARKKAAEGEKKMRRSR